jgi:transposase
MTKKTSDLIEKNIIENYLNGYEIKDIEKNNNIGVHLIYRVLRRYNIDYKGHKNRFYTNDRLQKMSIGTKKSWQNPKIRKERLDGFFKVKEQIKISRKINFGLYGETIEEEVERKKSYIRKYRKKYSKENPEKIKAHNLAKYYINIPKNQLCEICNKNKAKEKHHEDYSKPLEIKFLCVSCHQKLHRELLCQKNQCR